MLRELVEAAGRFQAAGQLPPVAYKPKRARWIVNLTQRPSGGAHLEGPYQGSEIQAFPSPDRQRAGIPSETNCKPYLLVDDARYVFGKPEPGREEEAELLHRGYFALLDEACEVTGLAELRAVRDFLASPQAGVLAERVEPRDMVAFRVEGKDPAAIREVQRFWAGYLANELAMPEGAQCGVCGREGQVLRILPREVVILGQKCQIISFNRGAFCSFGKTQNGNAPLCFHCASAAVDALDYLTRNERHRRVLVSDPKGGALQNQLAVFWLKGNVVGTSGGRSYDLEDLLGALLDDVPPGGTPSPELAQLEAMLRLPWTAEDSSLRLEANSFHLTVLSANQGRLVVREWLSVSLDRLKLNLEAFLQGTRLVGPAGEEARSQAIPPMVRSLGGKDPNLVRGLLRTAILGFGPPPSLFQAAVTRFRVPAARRDREWLQPLAGAIKLALTHRKEEVGQLEELDHTRRTPAYLCGRLLAVLDEAQKRASGWSTDTSVVDRFYGSAAGAPAVILPALLTRAQVSHLPKVRKEGRGHAALQRLLGEILGGLDQVGGFPRVLSLPEQGEFALGFYHQRAAFHRGAPKPGVQPENKEVESHGVQ